MAPPIRRSLVTRFTSNNYVVGALPTIAGVLFGCDISSMSGQLSNPYYLEQFNSPDSDLQGGITASMPAGSLGGALINSWLADKIGRKKTIVSRLELVPSILLLLCPRSRSIKKETSTRAESLPGARRFRFSELGSGSSGASFRRRRTT